MVAIGKSDLTSWILRCLFRLYQSLPEVKERDRLYKHKGQIQSNRIMLDSYKAVRIKLCSSFRLILLQ